MEIIKELNLNRNPQAVKNGSLINAWNIKLSEDGTYITADDSLHDVIGENIQGNIVGIIPCNKEFVVLTSSNKIYRFKEDDDGNITNVITVNSGWTYTSGKIKGTYSYNINGELIIVIACDNNSRTPLKTINLDKCKSSDFEDQYTTSPNVPVVNMSLVDRISGTPIPQGLYYFFARFKCQDDTYTNWFNIGVPQYAIAKRPLNVSVGMAPSDYRGDDVGTTLVNNIKFDCPYGFKFKIEIKGNNGEYTKMQLGYILQHDNGTFGRRWNEINLTNTGTSFNLLFDAVNPEEEDVVSLLESPVGLFDVKTLTSYENRVYAANYKETNYDIIKESSLMEYVNSIQVKQYISDAERFLLAGGSSGPAPDPTPVTPDVPVGEVKSFNYRIKIIDANGNEHITDIAVNKNINILNLYNYASDDALYKIRQCIRDAVIGNNSPSRFDVTYLTGNLIESRSNPGNFYHEVDHYYLERDVNSSPNEKLLYMKLPTTAELNVENKIELCNANGNSIPCYEFFDFDGRIRQDFGDYETGFGAGHVALSTPSDSRAGYWINGAVEDEVQNTGYFDTVYGYFLRCIDMTIVKTGINTVEGNTVVVDDTPSSQDSDSAHRKYNIRIPNAVRTLMPNEVYAFYVHYVRKDGSYTNGIQLENSATDSVSVDSFGNLAASGLNISNAIKSNFPNFEGVKNCELYTYSVAENSLVDFKVYKNINNKKLFYTCNGYVKKDSNYKICKIVPIFTNVRIPQGYVGVFFSYAKVDPLNLYYAYMRKVPGNEHLIEYKASEVETGACTYVGSLYDDIELKNKVQRFITNSNIYISNVPGKEYDDTKDYDTDINNKSQISTFGLEGCIGLNVFNRNKTLVGMTTSPITVANIRRHDNSIYSNDNVPLISLGQILYGNNTDTYIYGEHRNSYLGFHEFNYPSFICRDKIFTYKQRCFISDNGDFYGANYAGSLAKDNSNNIGNLINFITTSEVIKHSNFNLDGLSVKKEPEIIVKGNESGITGSYYTIKPINMSDLLQYPNDFVDKYYKTYTINEEKRANYDYRTSVIRRSHVLADESLENTWRYFDSIDYKVMPRDKGAITNLIGLGYYFLIHTEHTLYSIDRNNLLKGGSADVQVATPTTFDVEPKEMFTSSHGYGGLQTDSWTVNHNGYFFYDKDSIELYNVDNNGLQAITLPIKRLINKFNPTDAAIITDFNNNRIIICFKDGQYYLTISYNMFSKSFISLHSFKFDYGYNTKNRLYIRLNNSNLLGTTNVIGNNSCRKYRNWLNNSNGNLIRVSGSTYAGVNSFMPSVIDVIFNFNFEQTKTLNFVNWIIKLIEDWDNTLETNMADEESYSDTQGEVEETLARTNWYAGEVLRIYSDLTDSLDLDIEVGEKVNLFNNYKLPYFDKGEWNLNYFRNHLAKAITNAEKSASKGKGPSVPVAVRSDNRGLLYGRYFVLRFVFGTKEKYNLPFRFSNINIG